MRGDAFGCKLQAQIIARSPSTGRRERLDNGLDECCPLGIINGRCDAAGARPVYPPKLPAPVALLEWLRCYWRTLVESLRKPVTCVLSSDPLHNGAAFPTGTISLEIVCERHLMVDGHLRGSGKRCKQTSDCNVGSTEFASDKIRAAVVELLIEPVQLDLQN